MANLAGGARGAPPDEEAARRQLRSGEPPPWGGGSGGSGSGGGGSGGGGGHGGGGSGQDGSIDSHTAAEGTAVAEAEEPRLGLPVARDAATGSAPDEATGVGAALGEAPVDKGMEREAVPSGTVCRPPSARLLPRVQTTAR